MRAALSDLAVLLHLRWTLLLRRGMTRFTSAARLAAPFRLGILVLGAAWVLLILLVPLTGYFVQTLGDPNKRATLESTLAFDLSLFAALVFSYAVIALASSFTSRTDLELLLITPISPFVVLGEKILSTALGFSLLMLVSTPGLIAVGRALHAGVGYDLLVVLVLLLAPLSPVSLAMLLLLAVLRWVPRARIRAGIAVLGLLIGVAFFLGTQSLSRPGRMTTHTLPTALPTTWLGRSLAAGALGDAGSALAYLLGSALLGLLLLGAATLLSGRLLATGIGTYQEVHRRGGRGHVRESAVHRPARRADSNAWLTLVRMEWLSLRRDPQGLVTLAFPFVIMGYYAYRTFGNPSSLRDLGGSILVEGSLYGLLTFTAVMLVSSIAPLVVNREGYSLYLLALTPLRARTILFARWTICIVPSLIAVEAMLMAGIMFLAIPPAHAVLAASGLAAEVVALTGVDIAIHLLWPGFQARSGRRSGSGIAALGSFVAGFSIATILCSLLVASVALPGTTLPVLAACGLFIVAALVTALSAWAGSRLLDRFLTGRRSIAYGEA